MASVKQKQRKDDSIFFEISVSRGHGLSPYTMRWDRPEGLAGKTVKARLQAVASEFERDCRDGRVKTRKERKAEQEEAEQKKILEARNKMTFKRFCEETFLPDLRLSIPSTTISSNWKSTSILILEPWNCKQLRRGTSINYCGTSKQ